MSYDFQLLHIDAFERDEYREETVSSPLDPQKEAAKQKLATSLMQANPHLQIAAFDYQMLAQVQNISVEEARQVFRRIELNGPAHGSGIQITIFDDQVGVAVPYGHTGERAEQVFREVWQYLKLIQEEMGYIVYDPQLDQRIDLQEGYRQAMTAYRHMSEAIQGEQKPSAEVGNKPQVRKWWQFWRK